MTTDRPYAEEGRATWSESFAAASAAGATVCVANDPDADRLAAAEMPPGGTSEDDWRSFSGNEIGALLAHWTWTRWQARHPDRDPSSAAMLASAVSSKMLAAMAAKEGFVFRETLTGFKWLGNVAKDLEAEGLEVLFAFEEAIGFMFGAVHKDKDGVAAAAVFAEMAARIASEHGGRTVAQHLDWLYGEYGYHAGRAGYFVADTPDASRAVFERLRGGYPKAVGPLAVESVRDLGTGKDSGTADGLPTLPWTPGDMMITFRLAGGAELTLRASGTEPKLKYYLEVRAEVRRRVHRARVDNAVLE